MMLFRFLKLWHINRGYIFCKFWILFCHENEWKIKASTIVFFEDILFLAIYGLPSLVLEVLQNLLSIIEKLQNAFGWFWLDSLLAACAYFPCIFVLDRW